MHRHGHNNWAVPIQALQFPIPLLHIAHRCTPGKKRYDLHQKAVTAAAGVQREVCGINYCQFINMMQFSPVIAGDLRRRPGTRSRRRDLLRLDADRSGPWLNGKDEPGVTCALCCTLRDSVDRCCGASGGTGPRRKGVLSSSGDCTYCITWHVPDLDQGPPGVQNSSKNMQLNIYLLERNDQARCIGSGFTNVVSHASVFKLVKSVGFAWKAMSQLCHIARRFFNLLA